MKRESVLEKLQSVKDGADPSEVLEWLMGENGADITREKTAAKTAKDENRELKSQLDELQAKVDEVSKQNMSSEELLAKAKADYEEKLNDLNIQKNRVDAKASLTGAGLTAEEADKLMDRFVTSDEKQTSETVAALIEVLDSRKGAVEAATKQAMLQGTPQPSANTGGSAGENYKKDFEDASARNDSVAMAAAIRNGFMQTNM